MAKRDRTANWRWNEKAVWCKRLEPLALLLFHYYYKWPIVSFDGFSNGERSLESIARAFWYHSDFLREKDQTKVSSKQLYQQQQPVSTTTAASVNRWSVEQQNGLGKVQKTTLGHQKWSNSLPFHSLLFPSSRLVGIVLVPVQLPLSAS